MQDKEDVLCIASCGKAKIWNKIPQAGPTNAGSVYVGSYSRRCIEYAKKFYPSSWCILSAKYGFLLADAVVPGDHNVTFNDKSTNPITIDKLQKQAVEKNLNSFKKVVIIAGENYATIARQVFPNAVIITPLKGHGGNIRQAKHTTSIAEGNYYLHNKNDNG